MHVCGGRARCSTCRVLVKEGLEHCRPRNPREIRLAAIKGFSPNVHLACRTTTTGDLTLRRLVSARTYEATRSLLRRRKGFAANVKGRSATLKAYELAFDATSAHERGSPG